ncbi:MAG TPA: hypothetical protein VH113_01185 [Gemmatimonadales bacterium]|jgi:hypothetical protein|nr:hypothetical protein [Gemmatimonadales bacterium]
MMDGAREDIPRWPLALLRIYAGAVLLVAAAVQASQLGHALDVGVETLAGAALLAGVTTPAAALIAFVSVMSHAHFTKLMFISPGPRIAFAVLLLTVALGRAGRVFGFDSALARRFPRMPLF